MGVEACAEALTVRRDAAPSVFTITAPKPHKGQGGRGVSSRAVSRKAEENVRALWYGQRWHGVSVTTSQTEGSRYSGGR